MDGGCENHWRKKACLVVDPKRTAHTHATRAHHTHALIQLTLVPHTLTLNHTTHRGHARAPLGRHSACSSSGSTCGNLAVRGARVWSQLPSHHLVAWQAQHLVPPDVVFVWQSQRAARPSPGTNSLGEGAHAWSPWPSRCLTWQAKHSVAARGDRAPRTKGEVPVDPALLRTAERTKLTSKVGVFRVRRRGMLPSITKFVNSPTTSFHVRASRADEGRESDGALFRQTLPEPEVATWMAPSLIQRWRELRQLNNLRPVEKSSSCIKGERR